MRDYFKNTFNKNKWLPIVTKKIHCKRPKLWETQKKNQFIYELIWVYVIILLRSMEGVIDDALQSHTNRIYFFFHFVSFLDKYQPWASIIIELASDHRLTNNVNRSKSRRLAAVYSHFACSTCHANELQNETMHFSTIRNLILTLRCLWLLYHQK